MGAFLRRWDLEVRRLDSRRIDFLQHAADRPILPARIDALKQQQNRLLRVRVE